MKSESNNNGNFSGSSEEKEELSSKTLELMLFREMLVNSDFLSKISQNIDYRWFESWNIQIMARCAINFFNKTNGVSITNDAMESMLNRINEQNISKTDYSATKIDVTSCMSEYNKALKLNLGKIDQKLKLHKIQEFIRRQALKCSMLDAANRIEKGGTEANSIVGDTLKKFEDIQKLVFDEEDFGVEMSFDEIDESIGPHLDFLVNPDARISSGWDSLDQITHGGFYRDGRFLGVFMAQAGLGKSNLLANLGYNFLKQGLKVVVLSMEMSENVYLRRFDSIISKIEIDSLSLKCMNDRLKEILYRFYKEEHPEARLNIKEFSPGSQCARDIQHYIEKLEETKHWKPDVLILDYLNLIKPNSTKSKDSNMYLDGKAVSEELRRLTYDLGIPIITAVQCNSSGFNSADIGMENIAESRGIAHTADFIAGLYQTDEEKDSGIFHMKILKSRLGKTDNLRFQFDTHTMEFSDIGISKSDLNNATTVNPSSSSTTTIIDNNAVKTTDKMSSADDIDIDIFDEVLGM